jgi:hypothetical protein
MATILYGEDDFKGIFDISKECKFPVCKNKKAIDKYLIGLYHKFSKLKDQKIVVRPIDIVKIESIEQISQLLVDQGGFSMDPGIHDYIKHNAMYLLNYSRTIRGRDVTISIVVTEMKDISNFERFDEYVLLMYWWLDIAYGIINKSGCSKKLHVVLILTDMRKQLPDNIIDVIGKKHVNTGYTWPCKSNNKIMIYRKEEWFRVFVHESFHALGLDNIQLLTRMNKKIKELFPLNIDILVGEAYCEFWARIIKSAMFAFLINNATEDKYLYTTYRLINVERVFTLFQGIKVLKYMNLSYTDLINTDKESKLKKLRFYREDTNVFAYYVLPMLLMCNYCEFLEWCVTNNINTIQLSSSNNSQDALIEYIREIYKNDQFLDVLTCMTTIYDLKLLENKNKQLMNTTRMSIVDIS